jgi:hypothetical protein
MTQDIDTPHSKSPKRNSDGYPDVRTRIRDLDPHPPRRLKKPKAKGDAFEREVAEYLNTHLPGLKAHRAALSGGGFSWARGVAPGADLTGTPLLWVEAKRVESFSPHSAMAQAVKGSSAHHNADMPVVITRRNRQELHDSLCVMRLKDFITFYRALLETTGHSPLLALSSEETPPQEEDITHG